MKFEVFMHNPLREDNEKSSSFTWQDELGPVDIYFSQSSEAASATNDANREVSLS